MKKWKKILEFFSLLFVRLAHIFEHMTCDDVPFVDWSNDDDEEVS